ncbi:MAG: type IV secretion system protein [Rickettsiales bacterium]|nr:type IV secretion system protein [Rickettsiales bacterium]
MRKIWLGFITVFMFVAISNFSFADDNSCSFSCNRDNFKNSTPSQVKYSLTGRAFFCIKNALDIMLVKDCPQYNILQVLIDNLKPAIITSLVLFMVLLGIKLATSSESLGKKDFFSAILKFGFVWYFAIDGGVSLVYEYGVAAMMSLSGFMMESSGSGNFCNYSSSGYGEYQYLFMWDLIDCRLLQYLLINSGASLMFGVINIIIPLFFSIEIILALFFIIFAVFVIAIIAAIFHFFVLALIGLGLMAYFGVIFVPMILFTYTKHFFDNWWKTAVSFVLQPVVITIFIVFPFLLFDQVMYADCNFEENNGFWVVKSSSSDSCNNSLGYQMNKAFGSNNGKGFLKDTEEVFFNITKVHYSSSGLSNLLLALIKTLFFCYLFLLLTDKGGSLAAQLTSGPNIGKFAVNAGDIFNKFMGKITKRPGKKDESDDKPGGEGDGKGGSGVSASGKSSGGGGVSVSGGASRGGINVSGK